MGVQVHIASHPDALVARLCDELALPGGGLFDTELVAVPSRGIERWLTQRIASGMTARGAGDGICANVEFPTPRRLVHRTMEAVPELAGSALAWEGPALTAQLIETIDTHLDEPWMELLARYLDGAGGSSNRMAAAVKLAGLFTRYARRRPAMIRAWGTGEDVAPDGEPLVEGFEWQSQLWRRLRERIGEPAIPELLPAALDPVRDGTVAVDLPERFAVYGLTSTDPLDLEVLTALGEHRQVDLYVLHPSPALWNEIATAPPAGLVARAEDPTVELAAHPILKAWGRDSREVQTVLSAAGLGSEATWHETPARSDSRGSLGLPDNDRLLTRLQEGIRHNHPPTAGAVDRSVQIHVCHGARRQVEVLRDAILHVLADRPELEPRDVVIMTPDLATFAPLLETAFPRTDDGGLPDLRLRIADRAPAATNPLVAFTARLLEVADGRMEAAVIRDLVDLPPVQRKFGFDADTAGSIASLVDDANISWGIDEDHRDEWNVAVAERTWRRGLDRTLAGVFYSDSPVRTVGGLSPLDGVEGQEAIPAGILAALLDRLTAIREMLCRPRPLSEWAGAVSEAVRMLAAPEWGDEWQLEQLDRLLTETFPPPETPADPDVSLGEVRQAARAWTEDRPSPLHFGTGDITLCTLVPMRSVPYKVVALLGMDEDRFPRRGRVDGDDLLADHEVVGDRDPGAMDRQLLLDAVMAAGDQLIVTYSGRDELTNAEIPPSVPVAELIDTLAEMVGKAGMKRIVTHHPLQSFSPRNFVAGELEVSGPWGFDPAQHRGAVVALRSGSSPERLPFDWPPPIESDTIRLQDLIRFLQDPVGRFVSTRLGFSVPKRGDIADDTLPADLDSLALWGVKSRLLEGLIEGQSVADLLARERGSDALPPGSLGDDDLAKALDAAQTLHDAAQELGYDPGSHLPYAGVVSVAGLMIEGTVTADPEQAHLATVTPSRIKGKQRLESFICLAFLTALHPEVAWKASLLGRRPSAPGHVAVTIGPIRGGTEARQETALEMLAELVDLYQQGRKRPLPLPCETGFNWQRWIRNSEWKARHEATDAFSGRFGEVYDPAFSLVLPDIISMDELEREGFTEFCERLWLPVIALSVERNL